MRTCGLASGSHPHFQIEIRRLSILLASWGGPCPTAYISIKNSHSNYIQIRALLDTGASVSIIKDSLVIKLNLYRQSNSCKIYGIGNQSVRQPDQTAKIVIRPPISHYQSSVLMQLLCIHSRRSCLDIRPIKRIRGHVSIIIFS